MCSSNSPERRPDVRAFVQHTAIGLRLHFRNVMAIVYSYLFPTIFLIAFSTLYRYDDVPLVRHIGELLTITVLGGACFGLPTTLVSERERGVWRLYRLAPVSSSTLLLGTLTARYVLLIVAALLQLVLAMLIGMPAPQHPLQLVVAFSCVAFALMGLGLTIAALADNVPAVQALGQCVFLPMLILGGVAVPLASLPPWAERLSTFFPGRYAVEAIGATVRGEGLNGVWFSVAALLGIGAAAAVAGTKMFRWDRGQRFATTPGKGWVALALAAWAGVGVLALSRQSGSAPAPRRAALTLPAPIDAPSPVTPPAPAAPTSAPATPPASRPAPDTAHVAPPVKTRPAATADAAAPAILNSWRDVRVADIERDITFDRLPPDGGVVTPIALDTEVPDPDAAEIIADVTATLATWPPGHVADPVQRVRNLLAILATPDVLQQPFERYLPAVVYAHLTRTTTSHDLTQVLYWIAMHPDGGTQPTDDELLAAGLTSAGVDPLEARNRAAIYGVKLLGRLLGRL